MDRLNSKHIVTFEELRNHTDVFFERYWNDINGEHPEWSGPWDFDDSIPNNDKQGCYALFKNDELIYIGIGIGKSVERYRNAGLGDRLKRYWKVDKSLNPKTKYTTMDDWSEVTSIRTIGFSNDHYYIAAALEIYLIKKCRPPRNSSHK